MAIVIYLLLFTSIPAFLVSPGGYVEAAVSYLSANGNRPQGPFASLCQPLPTYASLPPTPYFFRQEAVPQGPSARFASDPKNRPENQGIKPKSNRHKPKKVVACNGGRDAVTTLNLEF
jgi:hypothetical protein